MAQRMPKKPRTKPTGLTKLTVDVHPTVVRALDAEVERLRKDRPGRKWSRSELIRFALARGFGKRITKKDRAALYKELLRKSGVLKLRAKKHLALNELGDARAAYLQAASLELEAFVLLDDPDESTVKTALIEILVLLKEGTGYKHFPEVPGGRRTVRSLQ